jgi:hypothetical protein
MGVEGSEARKCGERCAVEVIWGLGGYCDVVCPEVILVPFVAGLRRSEKICHGNAILAKI